MIDYFDCEIRNVSAHHVGNQANDEELRLSNETLSVYNEFLKEALLKYFFSHFNGQEFFKFNRLSEETSFVFNYVARIFAAPDSFHEESKELAEKLYEVQVHPNIKPGDFYVTYLSNIQLDGQMVDAIGLFKSENKDSFLILDTDDEKFELSCNVGTNTGKLDKGCLIFNMNKEEGYKLCIVDRSNRLTEAQYWKEDFLDAVPCVDDFHNTQNFMGITKQFVTKQMGKEFEMNKADQADLLNRSMDYFKSNETFNDKQFGQEIFEDEQVINAFHRFRNDFQEEKQIVVSDEFDISAPAVQKQSRVFKSVLKLDKNFHVYIHGDKKLIERGVDELGRKYYKLFYTEEN